MPRRPCSIRAGTCPPAHAAPRADILVDGDNIAGIGRPGLAAPDDATVTVRVFEVGTDVDDPEVAPGEGWAKNDVDTVGAWRSGLIRVDRNDEFGRDEGHTVVAVNGEAIAPGQSVQTEFGRVGMSDGGISILVRLSGGGAEESG